MMVADKMSYRPIGPIGLIGPNRLISTGIIFNTRAMGGAWEGAGIIFNTRATGGVREVVGECAKKIGAPEKEAFKTTKTKETTKTTTKLEYHRLALCSLCRLYGLSKKIRASRLEGSEKKEYSDLITQCFC